MYRSIDVVRKIGEGGGEMKKQEQQLRFRWNCGFNGISVNWVVEPVLAVHTKCDGVPLRRRNYGLT